MQATGSERVLQNDSISLKEEDEVTLLIWQKTDIGYNVIINNIHKGLIFDNEIFTSLRIGDRVPGFVKKIRDDGKIDVAIQAAGYIKTNDANSELIVEILTENGGFLAVSDKSTRKKSILVSESVKRRIKIHRSALQTKNHSSGNRWYQAFASSGCRINTVSIIVVDPGVTLTS